MTLIQVFHGTASNGTPLTAVYAEQPAADVAFALVLPGNDLPRFVHWGRPLAAPETVIDTFDALAPQRVSGALDYTAWPSVLPTQSEAWTGADRFDVRRDGVELFCKFQVTDIKAETVAAGKTYTMAEKDGYPDWHVAAEPKQTPTVTVTAEDVEQRVKLTWTCELDETGLIRQHAEVTNTGKGRLEIGKVELAFTVPADANEILTTTGHHLRERSRRWCPVVVRISLASAGTVKASSTLPISSRPLPVFVTSACWRMRPVSSSSHVHVSFTRCSTSSAVTVTVGVCLGSAATCQSGYPSFSAMV